MICLQQPGSDKVKNFIEHIDEQARLVERSPIGEPVRGARHEPTARHFAWEVRTLHELSGILRAGVAMLAHCSVLALATLCAAVFTTQEAFSQTPGSERAPNLEQLSLAEQKQAALERYRSVLYPNGMPQRKCEPTLQIDGIVKQQRGPTWVVHVLSYTCRNSDGIVEVADYETALSEIDESGEAPKLVRSVPLEHAMTGDEVVGFEVALEAFQIDSKTLGLWITQMTRISGAGAITEREVTVMAVRAKKAPVIALRCNIGSSGKGAGSYSSSGTEAYLLDLDRNSVSELVMVNTSFHGSFESEEVVETTTHEAYRFDRRSSSYKAIRPPSNVARKLHNAKRLSVIEPPFITSVR